MGWLHKDRDTDGGIDAIDEHAAPIEIWLGQVQRPFELEMLIGALQSEGIRLHLDQQAQIPEMVGGLGPRRCRVLVGAADEARVRTELAEAGYL